MSAPRTLMRIRSALLNEVHLLRSAIQKNLFPPDILANPALDESLLDTYHVTKMNPSFLMGLLKGVSLMMPPEKLKGLSVLEHGAFKTGEHANNKERLFCAKLMEHLKRAECHTTMPTSTNVADNTQRPVAAAAAAAAAAAPATG
jgi:hypothetical protein